MFVRGAKVRKTRVYIGYLFLGPDGYVIKIKGDEYYSGEEFRPDNFNKRRRLGLTGVRARQGFPG